jgi:hypothetical protein
MEVEKAAEASAAETAELKLPVKTPVRKQILVAMSSCLWLQMRIQRHACHVKFLTLISPSVVFWLYPILNMHISWC